MADNASLTAGDGTIIAGADEIGGVKYPRVKIIIGDDGSNDGDISAANPFPITGNLTASNSSVGTVGDPVPTDATLIAFQNGSGDLTVVETGVTPLPVFVANSPLTIDGAVDVSGSIVDVTGSTVAISGTVTIAGAVTNAGTFAVQATQAGTWNIGNVTGTVSLPTGASTAAKQPALGTAGTASADVITVQGIASMTPLLSTITGNLTTVSTVTAVTDITNNVKTVGPTAADAALTVSPVTVGARATNANPTNMSAAGDVVNLQADLGGRLVTIDAPRELVHRTQTALSNTTSETTIIGATASTFHDLYGLILANTGATATKVSIRDDTAGTVTAIIYVPAGETRGFMVPVASATPQTATNKNWTAQCSAATTAMEVTALYVDRI